MDIREAGDLSGGEKHPVALAFEDLKQLASMAESFELECRLTRDRLHPLDDYPGQDTLIDKETWSRLSSHPFDLVALPLRFSMRSVAVSIRSLEEAHARIAGVFDEPIKARTEDRLAFALSGLKKLEADLEDVFPDLSQPRTPASIRQQSFGHLLKVLERFLNKVAEVRRGDYTKEVADLISAIVPHEEVMSLIRADLARWRDDPGQKMSEKAEGVYLQSIDLARFFKRLKVDFMVMCHHAGIGFYNRAGRMTLEKIEAQRD